MKTLKAELYEIISSCEFARENLAPLETSVLICEKYGVQKNDLILGNDPCDEIRNLIISDVKRAASAEPLGYILGKVPFYKEEFFVGEGVLIPRQDSEVLVSLAIKKIPKNARFIDACCGTGCLGISILNARNDLSAIFLDISARAKHYTQMNIEKYALNDRAVFKTFDVLNERLDSLGDFSAVVMNPPYITKSEMEELPKNVLQEPALALYGGEDGLDFYRRIADQKDSLKNTLLLFEIGYRQGNALTDIFCGGKVDKDISFNDRVFSIEIK